MLGIQSREAVHRGGRPWRFGGVALGGRGCCSVCGRRPKISTYPASLFGEDFPEVLLRSLADDGCLITRGHWTPYAGPDDDLELAAAGIFPPNDDTALISVIVPPDFRSPEGLSVTPTWPIGMMQPDAFSCLWDSETGALVYNGD